MANPGDALVELGKGLTGCGCALTLLITIPVLIAIFMFSC
jgi:hypothetical protein